MVLPSRRFSLAETFCLAFVQTTQPCGTHPGCRALPSLHPPHRERIPQRASGAAPARQWKLVHKIERYIKNSNNKKSRIPWFLFLFVCLVFVCLLVFLQPPTPKLLSLIQTTMSTVWKHRPKLSLCRAARRKRLKKFSLWQKDSSNYTQCPQGAQILVCGNSDSSRQPRIERAVNNSDCTKETTVVSLSVSTRLVAGITSHCYNSNFYCCNSYRKWGPAAYKLQKSAVKEVILKEHLTTVTLVSLNQSFFSASFL